ncbi:MAG TPA: ABC transporter ATP-binding protein [Acidimicrobiales bacterium]|nr:ABC transporter ATP-binding protein [Acidimicrobiales bacterium]
MTSAAQGPGERAGIDMTTTRSQLAEPILYVQNVDFSYGRLPVLFGVSVHVQPGEALALLGTNGAGKSTLLRVVAGLERPSRGQIRLGRYDITGCDAQTIVDRGLILVPGGRAIFSDMTVAENLDMQAFRLRRQPDVIRTRRDRVVEVFPLLGKRWRQRAGTLSGGEQQQLALAKALMLDPQVLCVDELSLGLAPVVVQELLEIVARIRAAGVTLILVEQSLNIAASMCERAVFMEKGSVRFEGPTAELLERDDIARAVFLGETEHTPDHRPNDVRPIRRRRTKEIT